MASDDDLRKAIEEFHEIALIEHKTLEGVTPVSPPKPESPQFLVQQVRQFRTLAPIIDLLNSIDRHGWEKLQVDRGAYWNAKNSVAALSENVEDFDIVHRTVIPETFALMTAALEEGMLKGFDEGTKVATTTKVQVVARDGTPQVEATVVRDPITNLLFLSSEPVMKEVKTYITTKGNVADIELAVMDQMDDMWTAVIGAAKWPIGGVPSIIPPLFDDDIIADEIFGGEE